MPSLLTFLILLVCTATAHALMEIHIEGKDGWAAKLPTKKFDGWLIQKILGAPLTGYHLTMTATVLALAHLPILFVQPWSWTYEALVIGFCILHFTLEDFLWFVFNPHFGLRKFRPQYIWWHSRWFLGLPLGYWLAVPIGILFVTLGR